MPSFVRIGQQRHAMGPRMSAQKLPKLNQNCLENAEVPKLFWKVYFPNEEVFLEPESPLSRCVFDGELFCTLTEARTLIERSCHHDDIARPHSVFE